MAQQRGLGRGLDALFVDNSQGGSEAAFEIAMAEIEIDREQPRTEFDEIALAELADSIREHGVLQPILLRPLLGGRYRIVAGERRFRAAHLAGLASIPAIVREMSDQQAMEAALVENLQREDLNPVDEAKGYKKLIEFAGITQEQAAKRVGKSRSAVTNAMRLLTLPPHTLELLRTGSISQGHAKALLSATTNDIDSIADIVVADGLSVRQTESLGKKRPRQQRLDLPTPKNSVASEVELALRDALGVEVHVKYKNGSGTLAVDFYSKEQLFDFANRLGDG